MDTPEQTPIEKRMIFGIAQIRAGDTGFPPSLINGRYPSIWFMGDPCILSDLGTGTGKKIGFLVPGRTPAGVAARAAEFARMIRDAGLTTIGGFDLPEERESLDYFLKGNGRLLICPARGLEGMRIPDPWRGPLGRGRLLLITPFGPEHRRPTTALIEQRNRFVTDLAGDLFIAHTVHGSRAEALGHHLLARSGSGGKLLTLNVKENTLAGRDGVFAGTPGELASLVVQPGLPGVLPHGESTPAGPG